MNVHAFDSAGLPVWLPGPRSAGRLLHTAEGAEQYDGAWVTVNTFQFLGVPPRFTKRGADLCLPLSLDPADPQNKDRYLLFQARMKPGVTLKNI